MVFIYRALQIMGLASIALAASLALNPVVIPDSSSLVRTRGEVVYSRKTTGPKGANGSLYFRIDTVDKELMYPSYFSRENGADDLFQRGATIEIRHLRGQPNKIYTMVVDGRLLGADYDIHQFNRSNRRVSPVFAAFGLACILFFERLIRQEPAYQRKKRARRLLLAKRRSRQRLRPMVE